MRILHVVSCMNPKAGGIAQAVFTLATSLSAIKIESEVACFEDFNASHIQGNSFPIHALGVAKSAWAYNSQFVPWLKKNFFRFDTIITHGFWQYHNFAVRKTIKKLRKYQTQKLPDLFLMPHGMLDPYFQTASDRKLKAIRNLIYWKLVGSADVNDITGLLFTCKTECELARLPFRSYRPKKEIITGLGVEPPPLNTPEFDIAFKKKCAINNNQPYLLFLGRIDRKKGLDILLKAYSKLCELYTAEQQDLSIFTPYYIPKIVIAGPGQNTEYGVEIQKLVLSDIFLRTNVFFTGMLKGDSKWGAIYGCEAFILPSHQENFGIAVVEAMACSKPVLISNKINIWQEIKSCGGGIIENDTMDGVTRLLKIWVDLNNSEKEKMGVCAHLAFEKHFTAESAALKFARAINYQ